ncbi:WD40/YVTN/BNR-like repeat-containing protein [Gracilimonas halophila]|uniref:WD40/YVTN/BNR-like repeat-containing protein n=1 Tax=Gracilimonas halophila TaxID=1834464 RepID=A0ABW5JNT3_9BACT
MKLKHFPLVLLFFVLCMPVAVFGQTSVSEVNYNALELRNIGPAFNGGRIADIDIHPDNENIWYVAVGSGNVWKTTNAGTTWEPIFDNEGSYSIGSVTIDPNNPNIIWVGTGEDVGGRHVGFGDGIYKSTDAGNSWTNMGLENSEHLSNVIVHPENSDIVWVAAEGPLWSSGGERGLYKTTDGGENWTNVLSGNEWTGVTDILIDPRDPDVLYAATWQRHRTVAAYMGGGPGSGIHKSTDGGENWEELTRGLPSSNMGKIGLAISPQNPDIVYAAIELDRRTGGLYMSDDRGESWKKMSDAVSGGTGPHYYQELYASPHNFGQIILVSNYTLISDDHGANFRTINNNNKHVDDHAIAFKESDPDYIMIGTDGGLYESFDFMDSWRFFGNMPIMQYYKVSVDNAKPFYYVYGGTQDNGSNGGPSRTTDDEGIRNRDFFKTLGADGHDSATEPGNPNIVYGEFQQGALHRVDRITGESVFIQPQAGEGEEHERFNWDAPIEVSPHNPTRIYFASYRVWRTDDRGDSWTPISGDLTRDQERITLPIMGKQKSWDNPWDISAMSNYNTITSLAESPLQEGLIYAGTDDGLLQVTEDGGDNWRRIELGDIRGIPETAFVNDIKADLFDANTVYVVMDNHKYGDFTPYIIKSTNRGQSWTNISSSLPERHVVWRIVQDHVDEDLLFAATEFGIFFTVDGGNKWVQLKGGAPTISFRDITIQREQEDLVGASFGRGFFILDDYTPLREINSETLAKDGVLFPTRDALWYMPTGKVDSQGDTDYVADNPPFGAVFTYYLKEDHLSKEAQRQQRERQLDDNEDVPFPGWDALDEEIAAEDPFVQITIKDENGTVINRVKGPAKKGIHRVNWELRHASKNMITLESAGSGGWFSDAFPVIPGTYTASMAIVDNGETRELSEPISFDVVPLFDGALERKPNELRQEFMHNLIAFQQDLTATSNELAEQMDRIEAMRTALSRAESEDPALRERLHNARMKLLEFDKAMSGSEAKGQVGEKNPPTPSQRMYVGFRTLSTTYGPTQTHIETVEAGKNELEAIKQNIDAFIGSEMPQLQRALEAIGAPPIEN